MTEAEELELLELEAAEAAAKTPVPATTPPKSSGNPLMDKFNAGQRELYGTETPDYAKSAEQGLSVLGGGAVNTGKNLLTRAAGSGALGAAQSPEDRLSGFLKGAAFQAGGEAIAKPLNWGAEKLIQKAVGVREPSAEVGRELLDEGLWGTRGMMQKKVGQGIAKHSDELGEAVAGIPGKADVNPLAGKLQERMKDLSIGGEVPPNQTGLYGEYDKLAQYLGRRGELSYPELRKFKSAQGDAAYLASGKAGSGEAARAARAAERDAGATLSDAYSAANPGQVNRVDELNRRISSLYDAGNGLKRGESLGGYATMGGLGLLGGLIGGAPGAVAGAAAKTPLVQSAGAQTLDAIANRSKDTLPTLLRELEASRKR